MNRLPGRCQSCFQRVYLEWNPLGWYDKQGEPHHCNGGVESARISSESPRAAQTAGGMDETSDEGPAVLDTRASS